MARFKNYVDVHLVGYLSKPRIVVSDKGEFVFASVSTSIRENLNGELITRVETWHNLVPRTPVVADSIRLYNKKNRTVSVKGRLTQRTFEHKGIMRTVCEVQVFQPVVAEPTRKWQGFAQIQGTLEQEPHVAFPRPENPWDKVEIEIQIKTETFTKTLTGWKSNVQHLPVVFYGEQWIDQIRSLHTGDKVRLLTTLDYSKTEQAKTLVEVPQMAGLSLLTEAEILSVDQGLSLPNTYSRYLTLAV